MGTYLKIAPQNTDVTFTTVTSNVINAATSSGNFSGSFYGDGNGLYNLHASTAISSSYSLFAAAASSSISSSYALTASYAANASTTASYALQALSASYALISDYSSSLPTSSTVPYSVGGINAGTALTSLNQQHISIILDRLLFPAISPTYVNPSYSLTVSPNSLQEISSSINISLTGNFNRGGIYQPWSDNSFQNYRAGASTQYNFYNTQIGSINQAGSVYSYNNYITIIGYNNFNSAVTYSAGPQPLDNFGNATGSIYPAGTLTNSTSYEGVYPIYATTVDVSTATKQGLISMLNGNNIQLTLAAESGGNKQAFWLPNAWISSPTNRPLVGVYYFNTVSGQFDTTNKIGDFNTSSASFTIQGNTIAYTKYTYNGVTRGSILIKLNF
jgi:hypothetical protein